MTEKQKWKAMGIMLKGPAHVLFAKNIQQVRTYDESIVIVLKRYNNREKKYRLLNESQEMQLTRAMRDDPAASEMYVFQTFVARAMAIQEQLSNSYQVDRYLPDRLQESNDIPAIQNFLKDQPARCSLDILTLLANTLSDRPKTAGSVLEN